MDKYTCGRCGKEVPKEGYMCPYCHVLLVTKEQKEAHEKKIWEYEHRQKKADDQLTRLRLTSGIIVGVPATFWFWGKFEPATRGTSEFFISAVGGVVVGVIASVVAIFIFFAIYDEPSGYTAPLPSDAVEKKRNSK